MRRRGGICIMRLYKGRLHKGDEEMVFSLRKGAEVTVPQCFDCLGMDGLMNGLMDVRNGD